MTRTLLFSIASVAVAATLVTTGCETESGAVGTAANVTPIGGTGEALPPGHPPMGASGMPGSPGAMPPGHGAGMAPPGMPPGHGAAGMPPGHGAAGAPPGMGGAAMPPGHAALGVEWTAPKGWVEEIPSSTMRKGQFRLLKIAGDPEDGSLVVYYFGGEGGDVTSNLDRWYGQFTQPDGTPSKTKAKVTKSKAGAMEVTLVDLTGTFVAETTPGSGVRVDKAGWRLLAAIILAPDGPYFIKATGPEKTMEMWKKSFEEFVSSFRPVS